MMLAHASDPGVAYHCMLFVRHPSHQRAQHACMRHRQDPTGADRKRRDPSDSAMEDAVTAPATVQQTTAGSGISLPSDATIASNGSTHVRKAMAVVPGHARQGTSNNIVSLAELAQRPPVQSTRDPAPAPRMLPEEERALAAALAVTMPSVPGMSAKQQNGGPRPSGMLPGMGSPLISANASASDCHAAVPIVTPFPVGSFQQSQHQAMVQHDAQGHAHAMHAQAMVTPQQHQQLQQLQQHHHHQQHQQLQHQHQAVAMNVPSMHPQGGAMQSAMATMQSSSSFADIEALTRACTGGDALHKRLLDLLPQPIFLRSAAGNLLYANQACNILVGVNGGGYAEPWQITPQMVMHAHLNLMGGTDNAGEVDIPREPVMGTPPMLPPPANNFCVLLQDKDGRSRHLISTHRVPFWMATADGTGRQRAVVLYVGSG